ncbi:unnamed protein product [Amoebophrya sp. A120]|nr:unnamed protein product [Amoebophrya sp. A120]|eukprot:GSA120T00007641001.1
MVDTLPDLIVEVPVQAASLPEGILDGRYKHLKQKVNHKDCFFCSANGFYLYSIANASTGNDNYVFGRKLSGQNSYIARIDSPDVLLGEIYVYDEKQNEFVKKSESFDIWVDGDAFHGNRQAKHDVFAPQVLHFQSPFADLNGGYEIIPKTCCQRPVYYSEGLQLFLIFVGEKWVCTPNDTVKDGFLFKAESEKTDRVFPTECNWLDGNVVEEVLPPALDPWSAASVPMASVMQQAQELQLLAQQDHHLEQQPMAEPSAGAAQQVGDQLQEAQSPAAARRVPSLQVVDHESEQPEGMEKAGLVPEAPAEAAEAQGEEARAAGEGGNDEAGMADEENKDSAGVEAEKEKPASENAKNAAGEAEAKEDAKPAAGEGEQADGGEKKSAEDEETTTKKPGEEQEETKENDDAKPAEDVAPEENQQDSKDDAAGAAAGNEEGEGKPAVAEEGAQEEAPAGNGEEKNEAEQGAPVAEGEDATAPAAEEATPVGEDENTGGADAAAQEAIPLLVEQDEQGNEQSEQPAKPADEIPVDGPAVAPTLLEETDDSNKNVKTLSSKQENANSTFANFLADDRQQVLLSQDTADIPENVEYYHGKDLCYSTRPALFDANLPPTDLLSQIANNETTSLAAIALVAEYPGYVKETLGPKPQQPDVFVSDNHSQSGLSKDDRYSVRLFDFTKSQFFTITLDDLIPCSGEKNWYDRRPVPVFSQPCGNELFALLLEKALAKLAGSYANLSGAPLVYYLSALTGTQPTTQEVWDLVQPNQNLNVVKNKIILPGGAQQTPPNCFPHALYTKKVSNAELNFDDFFSTVLRTNKSKQIVSCVIAPRAGARNQQKRRPDGLVEGFPYALLEARIIPCSGALQAGMSKRMLKFRNPFGKTSCYTGAFSRNDMENWKKLQHFHLFFKGAGEVSSFWMEYTDFLSIFSKVYVCPLSETDFIQTGSVAGPSGSKQTHLQQATSFGSDQFEMVLNSVARDV